jgi:preprotein translocase subunit SecD
VSPPSRSSVKRRQSMVVSLVVVLVVAFGSLLIVVASGVSPKLGLDLAGGAEVVFQPTQKTNSSELTTAVNIMRLRVDGAGVSGSEINTQGNDIVVELPGVKNSGSLIKTIGTTAELQARPVLCFANDYTPAKKGSLPSTGPLPACGAAYQTTAANLDVSTSSSQAQHTPSPDPTFDTYLSTPSTVVDNNQTANVLVPASPGSSQQAERFVLGPVGLLGKDVSSAKATLGGTGNSQWVVNITLSGTGTTKWNTLAQANFHQLIAFVLDGQVISAPLTLPSDASFVSFGNSIEISGSFTQGSANQLAELLTYGALPVPLKIITHTTVSPSLGKSSLKAGLIAGIGGLFLVLVYMIVYYRALGFVVIFGLAVSSALLWVIVTLLGQSGMNLTLDLAGVTGLIVSIGITADSYVIYFERLKDQVRAGRTVRSSIDKSFAGAFRTVLAADLVSLIGALVLWIVAIGTVRGFAFFLGLSTLLNIIITYFFTRPLVFLIASNETLTENRTFGVAKGLASEAPA